MNAPVPQANPASGAARGRWIWRLSGVLTIAALTAATGVWVIVPPHGSPDGAPMSARPARTFTVTSPVTALNVQSYGAPIKVTASAGGPVLVTESVAFDAADGPPAVYRVDSNGVLTLAAPACAQSDCSVAFTITVPAGVAVTATADGGTVSVAGTAATTIDAGGGPVYASRVTGPLTVNAESGDVTIDQAAAGATVSSGGGPVTVSGVTGPLSVTTEGGSVQADGVTGVLNADTGGGPLSAARLGSATATVTAEGGDVTLGFTSAPQSVLVSTGGGQATLSVPGGPYSVTANSGGATSSVSVPASPAAARSISVSTDGGNLQIAPA